MARYLWRLSLIVCFFWIGCALQREYRMGQPLKCLRQNDLQKCPVENVCDRLHIAALERYGRFLNDWHESLWWQWAVGCRDVLDTALDIEAVWDRAYAFVSLCS